MDDIGRLYIQVGLFTTKNIICIIIQTDMIPLSSGNTHSYHKNPIILTQLFIYAKRKGPNTWLTPKLPSAHMFGTILPSSFTPLMKKDYIKYISHDNALAPDIITIKIQVNIIFFYTS